jgi:hypothetical protein
MKKSFLFFATMLLCSVTLFAQKHHADDNQVDDEQITYRKYRKPVSKLIYPNKIFCFYPLAGIASNFKVGLERRLSDVTSIKTNVRIGFNDESNFYRYDKYNNYYTASYSSYNQGVTNLFNAMLEFQYRYYFADKAPQGFYGGFYGYYKMATFNSKYSVTTAVYNNTYPYNTTYNTSNGSESLLIHGGGAGILVGNQFITSSKIAFDFYMGSGMFFTSPNGKYFKGLNGVADRYFNGIGFILGANIGLGLGK